MSFWGVTAPFNRKHGRWAVYLKQALVWMLFAALILGHGLAWSFLYEPIAGVSMTIFALILVVLWEWIARGRKAAKVRQLLEEQTFPVNIQSSPPITTARPDSWLLLRGTPKAIAVDLTHQLIWLLIDHRRIHALRPSAVSSVDIVNDKDLLGRPRRVLRLICSDASPSFAIDGGDEGLFRTAMAQLLAAQIKASPR